MTLMKYILIILIITLISCGCSSSGITVLSEVEKPKPDSPYEETAVNNTIGDAAQKAYGTKNASPGSSEGIFNTNNQTGSQHQNRTRNPQGLNWYNGFYDSGNHYIGYRLNNQPHGLGIKAYPDGRKYIGEWQNGKRHGHGTITWLDGSIYAGEWQEDNSHGQGTQIYADARKYIGAWRKGRPHGQGIFIYGNGDKYVGEFQNNTIQGQGTYTHPDGRKYEGGWLNGIMHGKIKGTHTNGFVLDAVYRYGKMISGTVTLADGTVMEGNWETNRGKIIYQDGKIYEGQWVENGNLDTEAMDEWAVEIPDGLGIMRYPNGEIEDGYWDKGEFIGTIAEK